MTSHSATSGTPRETVFDVDVERLARVYGQAVLDAAGDDQNGVIDELQALVVEVLDKFPDLEEVFASALVSMEEKLTLLDRLFDKRMSATGLSFLKVLTKHGRLGYLRHVVRHAGQLWSERSNRVPVNLQLAHELESTLHQEVVKSLSSALGVDPVVTTTINPELIAGFVVRVGDKVYDASARTRLEKTRQAIIERAIDAFQSQPDLFVQGVNLNSP